MKYYYYIVKGRKDSGYSSFWEDSLKGVVVAPDKESARAQVSEILGQSCRLPMRIKAENIKPESLLLAIYEVDETHYVNKLVHARDCLQCGFSFKPVDKFNLYGAYGDWQLCSPECEAIHKAEHFTQSSEFHYAPPTIYCITHIPTGRNYVGQTTRAFTLRWWEHIKSTAGDRFHIELRSSKIEEWSFRVLEVMPEGIPKEVVTEREKHWIEELSAVASGFNSVGPRPDNQYVIGFECSKVMEGMI